VAQVRFLEKMGTGLETTFTLTKFTFEPFEKSFKAAVTAIVHRDAAGLCDAISKTQFPAKYAQSIALQAWRADVTDKKVGVRMRDNGMLSAVFIGVTRAQERAGTLTRTCDNAISIMCDLAANLDEPAVLDVLIAWAPDFRVEESRVSVNCFVLRSQISQDSNRL
jgi:hypothetical protein